VDKQLEKSDYDMTDKYMAGLSESGQEFLTRYRAFNPLLYCKEDDANEDCHPGADQCLSGESIITFKVCGSCRHKECAGAGKISPAMADGDICAGDKEFIKGRPVSPPKGTIDIGVEGLTIAELIITDKKRNKSDKDFWDIRIRYVFKYKMTFYDIKDRVIGSIPAYSAFNQELTLFCPAGRDRAIGSDLLSQIRGTDRTIKDVPYVFVKAKAVIIERLFHVRNQIIHDQDSHVQKSGNIIVVIGLFTQVSLFRVAAMNVKSNGFCVTDKLSGEDQDLFKCGNRK